MNYQPFGPYILQGADSKPTAKAVKDFWKEAESDSGKRLSQAVGIYIFVLREDQKSEPMPWYVGRACQQVFQVGFGQKNEHFIRIPNKSESGQLEVSFLALMSKSGNKLSNPTSVKGGIATNKWLEKKLINDCYRINPKFLNVADAKHTKTISVPGYLNNSDSQVTGAALNFKNMMNQAR